MENLACPELFNVSNRSLGGGCRMESMGYKVDGMIPTSYRSSHGRKKWNPKFLYSLHKRSDVFSQTLTFLPTEIHSSEIKTGLVP